MIEKRSPLKVFKHVSPSTGEILGYHSFKKSRYQNGNNKYEIVDTNGVPIREVTLDIDKKLDEYSLAVKTRSAEEILLKSLGIVISGDAIEVNDEYTVYRFNEVEMNYYTSIIDNLVVIKGGQDSCKGVKGSRNLTQLRVVM